jgi:hypothetical protein
MAASGNAVADTVKATTASLIAMFVVGGVLLITFMTWEALYAAHPIQPKSLLINRTFVSAGTGMGRSSGA